MSDAEPSSPLVAPAPPTILLVDDEPSILSALRRLLRPQGCRILTAESGADALALLAAEPVALVISDMRMPQMSGAEFLAQVRTRWPDAVRVLLTGYADIASTIAAINGGEIHRYVAKPWDDHDLVLLVREALTRRQLERDNRALQALTQAQNEQLQALNGALEARVRSRTDELAQVNGMLEKAYEELQQNFVLSIGVFSGLLELRHSGMSGHARRVAGLARRVAARMGLPRQAQDDIAIAASLHDIGKIGFPDGMLGKPVSRLVGDEIAVYRRHPLDAEAALMPLAQLHRAAKIVRNQHERYDGRGFPDGLVGEAIPLGARLLAVVNDHDGLMSGLLAERCYTPGDATKAIRQSRGERYDPAVVEAFLQVLAEPDPTQPVDRLVGCHAIQVGMVLSRDLLGPQGTLLLAAGFAFDARTVRQIREYAQRQGTKMSLHIRQADESVGVAASPVT